MLGALRLPYGLHIYPLATVQSSSVNSTTQKKINRTQRVNPPVATHSRPLPGYKSCRIPPIRSWLGFPVSQGTFLCSQLCPQLLPLQPASIDCQHQLLLVTQLLPLKMGPVASVQPIELFGVPPAVFASYLAVSGLKARTYCCRLLQSFTPAESFIALKVASKLL